jgi:hypothetical protein
VKADQGRALSAVYENIRALTEKADFDRDPGSLLRSSARDENEDETGNAHFHISTVGRSTSANQQENLRAFPFHSLTHLRNSPLPLGHDWRQS